jgi:hypothetical protein
VAATGAGAFAVVVSGAAPALVVFILLLLAAGMTGIALVAAIAGGLQLIYGPRSSSQNGLARRS